MFNFKLNPLQDVVYPERRFVKKFSMLFYPLKMLEEGWIWSTGSKIR